jgi:hypothetical protein
MNSGISDTKYVTLYKALRVGRPVRPLLPVDSLRQQTVDQIVKYFTKSLLLVIFIYFYIQCVKHLLKFLLFSHCVSRM